MQIKSKNILNLLPMLNLVLILFVLVWCLPDLSTFYEIASSTLESNKEELTLVIHQNQMTLSKGSDVIKKFPRDLDELHQALSEVKSGNSTVNTISLKPSDELTYEELVRIMDVAKNVSINEILFGNIGK